MAKDKVSDNNPSDKPEDKGFHIRIDRTEYVVTQEKLTGAELRGLPSPPVSSDRDLYQVVSGGTDMRIKDDDTVVMKNGLRFFTSPGNINPGTL